MKDWRETLVGPGATLLETINKIDASALQVALVVDSTWHLLGTVTDGDVRRALLRGVTLDACVQEAMNRNPVRAYLSQERDAILALMHSRAVRHVPVVNDAGVVVGLEILEDLVKVAERPNWVVLVAGGLGSRLAPLTRDTPKPMLRLGDRPILEHILEAFIGYGFRRYFIAINYLGEMIQEHFGDGSRWGVAIEYLCERERLGTAGALSLLPSRPPHPVLVMNGDIVTKINFAHLLEFHVAQRATATMCVRSYEYQIPYGVVTFDGERLTGVTEKPQQQCYVSAGTYVIAPEALDHIEAGRPLDMPLLFEKLIAAGHSIAAFPVREYWLDIGRLEDLERAHREYESVFVRKPAPDQGTDH